MGDPRLWLIFHIYLGITFAFYTLFHLWLLYKDITTLELMDLLWGKDNQKYIPRFQRRSFKANLLLIFGTPNLLKALFLPLLDVLPINGLEYEHDKL